MKKFLITFIAVVLVAVMACGLAACNQKSTKTDSSTSGHSASLSNLKIEDVKYVAPTASTLTEAETDNAIRPVMNKLVEKFSEGDSISEESIQTTVRVIHAICKESGFDKAFLDKYATGFNTLLDGVVGDLLDIVREIDSESALFDRLDEIITVQNIQTMMTFAKDLVGSIDTNQAYKAAYIATELLSFNDIYTTKDFATYDYYGINAAVRALGEDPANLTSAAAYVYNDVAAMPEAIYCANVAMHIADNVLGFSATDIEQAAKVVLRILRAFSDNDGSLSGLLSSSGLGNVSYKDIIKAVNVAGRLLETMMDGINVSELGKALGAVMNRIWDAEGNSNINVLGFVNHPEIILTAANILKGLTAEQVSGVYLDYDDWQTKLDTADEDRAYAVLISGIVNIVKDEYNALSAACKTDIAAMMGGQDLLDAVDALIALVPADKESVTNAGAAKIVEAWEEVADLFEYDMYKDRDYYTKGKYHLYVREHNSAQVVPMFIFADVDGMNEDALKALLNDNYCWNNTVDSEYHSNRSLSSVDYTARVVNRDGKKYIELTGEEIETAYIQVRTDRENVVGAPEYYWKEEGIARVPVGATADEIRTALVECFGEWNFYYGGTNITFAFYDKVNKKYYDNVLIRVDPACVEYTPVSTAKAGTTLVVATYSTTAGIAKSAISVVVYDPENPQVESIEAGASHNRIPVGASASALGAYVHRKFDNGARSYEDWTEGVTVTDFKSDKRGDYYATVSYKGKTDTVRYHVYDPNNLVVYDIDTQSLTNGVQVGTVSNLEELKSALGLKVIAIMDDGVTEREITDYAIYDVRFEEGSYNARILYNGDYQYFWYYILDYEQMEPYYINAYGGDTTVGTAFKDTYARLDLNYDDGYRYIYAGYPGLTVSGYDPYTVGTQHITISYGGYSCDTYIDVYAD